MCCRQQWLLALQCQADAAEEAAALKTRAPAAQRRAAAAKLGRAFEHRCHLEACLDDACSSLVKHNAQQWGAVLL